MSITTQHVNHKDTIISLQDVSFSYGDTSVLEQVSLSVHRGDYLGLVGGNGAGKSTLVKIMLGLLTPSKGNVKLFDEDITRFKQWSKIGYVPQRVIAFDQRFPVSVIEVVLMGRYGKRGLFKRITATDYAHAVRALDLVGMSSLKDRLIGDLSGGQQQRVFIARALAGEPAVLILDEPTVGVSKEVKEEFYSLLDRLNGEHAITIVLIAHDVTSMGDHAMHVACLDRTLTFHDVIDKEFKDTHGQLIKHES